MNPSDTTVVCPLNDAESFTIVRIAKRLGYETRVSVQNDWFCPLDREPEHTFQNLKQEVIIIEMPGSEREQLLRRDHVLHIVDHHDYASLGLHRDNALSSLEQFALLVGYSLTRDERGIALNDQKYIYGLAEEGYAKEEIGEIRRLDLLLQGYTDEDFRQSDSDVANGEIQVNGVTLYRSSLIEKFSYLLDLHVLKNDCRVSDVAITGKAKDAKGTYIFFSGKMATINQLKTVGGYSKQSTPEYGFWGGFEHGIEKVDLKQAMDMIVGKV